nr:MAG: ORF1 [Torque teno midi virus]
MPWWWKRRRRPWFGRYKRKARRNKFYRRKRFNRRRRNYKPTRRHKRRKRRYRKVRRKRKTIPVLQWQPDSITKCKIKGLGIMVLGAEGKQLICYTPMKTQYLPPKAPMGGGFGVEKYTLSYLYEEFIFHNNIWTKSNITKDLCRYLYCRFTFFRDPRTDFIISYQRQPPFDLTKFTYASTHPHQMLLDRHHKVLFSKDTKPNGKYSVKFLIKPPKQMISKWFFTKHFCQHTLALIKASACNFRCSYLSCSNRNQLVNITYLQQKFYQNSNWGMYATTYKPYNEISTSIKFTYKSGNSEKTYSPNTDAPHDKTPFTNYDAAVSYDWGWFSPKVLASTKVENGPTETHATQAITPISVARYNPNTDNGKGNKIYIKDILKNSYSPPERDPDIILEGFPLWLGLYGFLSWVVQTKHEKNYLQHCCVMLQSPSITPYSNIGEQNTYLPLDQTFITGKAPYDEYLNENMKVKWWPNVNRQMQTLNAIVESGPYIQNYSEDKYSNWELKYKYLFCFKWGGPQNNEPDVADPKSLPTYPTPDTVSKSIQIVNPEKLSSESILHSWDFRRGIVTPKAFKRMLDNISTDTEFQPTTEPAKKKPRTGPQLLIQTPEEEEIQSCLHSLCEENTCQETQEKTIQQLIQQQQQQQEQLKYNLLKLMFDLKEKQKMLQLQTGLLE